MDDAKFEQNIVVRSEIPIRGQRHRIYHSVEELIAEAVPNGYTIAHRNGEMCIDDTNNGNVIVVRSIGSGNVPVCYDVNSDEKTSELTFLDARCL